MKVLLPGDTKPWAFVVFSGGFGFSGYFFLVMHTYCLHRFLPSIFNTSSFRDTTYAIFDILLDNDAKILGSKDVKP
jgi:hypothetical protein